jgi:hypothetical protein
LGVGGGNFLTGGGAGFLLRVWAGYQRRA